MRPTRYLFRTLTLLIVVITVRGNRIAGTINTEQAQHIDRLFEKWNHSDSPGCALSVMHDGQIVYEHGYGMADLGHGAPITPTTPFHVASVSKQFTAAAIVLLAEKGKLSIDDDVRKYIPELPDFGVRITIRNLLHHTSGLRDQWDLLEFAGWRYSLDLITNQDVFDVVTRQKELNFRPGDRFVYSNTGYTLLGEIVKRVSGKSLREFTTEHIFEPLGMIHTHFRDDHAEVIKGEAFGYEPDRKGGWRLSVTNFDTVGATSLYTTVQDLWRWDNNFYTQKVGGSHFRDEMLHRDRLNDGQLQNYAFGLILGNYRGLPTVEHLGADAGYRAGLIRFPQLHFSVACLCNAGPSAAPGTLEHKVVDFFLGSQYTRPAPSSASIQVTSEQLQRLAGSYWNPNTDEARMVVLKNGILQLSLGEDLIPLQPVAQNVFKVGNLGIELHVLPAAGDKPTRIQAISDYGSPETFEMLPPFDRATVRPADYEGTYVSDEVEPAYHITAKNRKLVLQRLKHGPESLYAIAPDLFTIDFGTVRFVRNREHHVSRMLVSSDRVYNLRFDKQTKSIDDAGSPTNSGVQGPD